MTIYCNMVMSEAQRQLLLGQVGSHKVIFPTVEVLTNFTAGPSDPASQDAQVMFGQPSVGDVVSSRKLKLVQLTSAGYSRFTEPSVREHVRSRGIVLCTSSTIGADPCAQHILSMMLACERRLYQAYDEQRGGRGWPMEAMRESARVLTGQNALIIGLGTIGRRLTELLAPFRMNVTATRRTIRGDEPVPTFKLTDTDRLIPQADHVINILPEGSETEQYFNAGRLWRMKPGAVFYNIGRGSTVDQDALRQVLAQGRIRAAYLDVTTPEPLPTDNPLWTTPNCYITPHMAGGLATENEELIKHFAYNLERYSADLEPRDRVM